MMTNTCNENFADDVDIDASSVQAFNPDAPIMPVEQSPGDRNHQNGSEFASLKRSREDNGSEERCSRVNQLELTLLMLQKIFEKRALAKKQCTVPESVLKKLSNVQTLLISGKSPVSILNELNLNAMYSILPQAGPPHCPVYTATVTVLGVKVEGNGSSKREAKTKAALSTLQGLYKQFICSSPSKKINPFLQALDGIKENSKPQKPVFTPPPTLKISNTATPPPTLNKSPVNQILETYPDATFIMMYGDGSAISSPGQDNKVVEPSPETLQYSTRFKVQVKIGDSVFEGYGASKKFAKIAASKAALAGLAPAQPVQPDVVTTLPNKLPQSLADQVAKLILEKFSELMRGDPLHVKRKVLAGIVVTKEYDLSTAKVICVTTGTKCISGERLSARGIALNDCHAEVVSRRCLQRYIYDQLYKYSQQTDPTQPLPDCEIQPCPSGGYFWDDAYKIHLYISTAPCGDGRIFSPHEEEAKLPDRHPNRLTRGQLRTKIESGEGTIPVNKSDPIQTWDGVLQGSRLLTMSCSDKLARWCLCGLQGALLSTLVKPIYLHSLVLGSLLSEQHIYRAIYERISSTLKPSPSPWSPHVPLLAKANSIEARVPAKAPGFSVNWTFDREDIEVVNCVTGKIDALESTSALCKQLMFGRWLYVIKKLTHQPYAQSNAEGMQTDADSENVSVSDFQDQNKSQELTYKQAKATNNLYQVVKNNLYEAFDKAGLGRWVQKPMEQDLFVSELSAATPQTLFL